MSKFCKGLVAVIALGMGAACAEGAILIDFLPTPLSPSLKEFEWSGLQGLREDVGAFGGNDVSPPANASPGGLKIEVPMVISGIPGSQINAGNGSTTIFDVTLDLEHLSPRGPAVVSGGRVHQPLAAGTFRLLDTTGQLLLAGTVGGGVITGMLGGDTATVQAGFVHYAGGPIHAAMQGKYTADGELSFAMIDLSTPLSASATGGTLAPFTANGTGQFSATAVPEPGMVALVVAAGGLLAGRRRLRA
jgi:hypothetical protein